jgi:hypothetical protein
LLGLTLVAISDVVMIGKLHAVKSRSHSGQPWLKNIAQLLEYRKTWKSIG